MSSSSVGLLIISNLKLLRATLSAAKQQFVNGVLYIHLRLTLEKSAPPAWNKIIGKIYSESVASGYSTGSLDNDDVDVRLLITPLKVDGKIRLSRPIDVLLYDEKFSDENSFDLVGKYGIITKPVYLSGGCSSDCNNSFSAIENSLLKELQNDLGTTSTEIFDNVVLGGTFDRIHVGHKILLTEAVLRARKRVVVGVTDANMVKSKRLPELILPVEKRIADVKEFLQDIDNTLKYDVVAIQDPYGPTKVDPNMDMIIVSKETLKGGHKVNEVRVAAGLKPLRIHCIEMIETEQSADCKELKISSGNTRIDLLGTRIRKPEQKPHLPYLPYIIGLTGGIAAGKSKMSERFSKFGAKIIDCDKLAHELYEPAQICYEKLIKQFGTGILDGNERIDRKKLGTIVFSDPKQLELLNNIVWPEILIETKKRIKELYEKTKSDIIILEAAVLLQAGWQNDCHEVWSMIIPRDEAIERLKIRNNLSDEEARQRVNAQVDNATVVENSNLVFSSEWSYEFTQQQAEKAWSMLMKEINDRK